ncbi:hypothetical protein QUA13_27940, partial [Microcoleus sp. S28C3]|uniref:hypothetical protein n=1 Tax=Microcoleus sp. S28C3 TaxID=3055414 RepID=UPI002FD0899E
KSAFAQMGYLDSTTLAGKLFLRNHLSCCTFKLHISGLGAMSHSWFDYLLTHNLNAERAY